MAEPGENSNPCLIRSVVAAVVTAAVALAAVSIAARNGMDPLGLRQSPAAAVATQRRRLHPARRSAGRALHARGDRLDVEARSFTLRSTRRQRETERERARHDLAERAVQVGPARVLAAALEGADAKSLRETVDKLKDKLGSAAIVLAANDGGKVALVAGVTPDLTAKVKAGELVNFVAQQVGGKGGGRPDMAMAGGTDPAALPKALESVRGWVAERL